MASASASSSSTSPVLYDMPISNAGARVRFVLYKKKLEGTYEIRPPSSLGGLKTPEYLALNPQGKMPLLVIPGDGSEGGAAGGVFTLPESEVIVQYLIDKHATQGPSLTAPTPELRARCALITRIHDTYLQPIQACMYRQMDSPVLRAKDIATIAFQLDVLEKTLVPLDSMGEGRGAFGVGGNQMTSCDGALFPTMVFMDFILPTYFGWKGLWSTRPRLSRWWEAVKEDPEARRVIGEVREALEGWKAGDRWKVQGITEQVETHKELKWDF